MRKYACSKEKHLGIEKQSNTACSQRCASQNVKNTEEDNSGEQNLEKAREGEMEREDRSAGEEEEHL